MWSDRSVLPLILGMIPTADQAFKLGFKSGSLYLASSANSNHGKDYLTMNTSDLKIKIGTSCHTYIPVWILRPQGHVSPHFTFLSPHYQLYHRLHIFYSNASLQGNLTNYPSPHHCFFYILSLCFFCCCC